VVKAEPVPVAKKPAEDKPAIKETSTAAEDKPAPVSKPLKMDPVTPKEGDPVKPVVNSRTPKNFNGGFFKADFDKQSRGAVANETGMAGIFKSTSGWDDGKYYCLHNTAAPGSIVKITSTSTGKTVYAKVLDTIPDMAQNNGLLMRLSNAAAAELGVGESKFDCSIGYIK
jgi:hypothetical protein